MSDICSQTQTPLLLGGRRELPAILQRTNLAQGPGLLLPAGHGVLMSHSICVCTTYSRAGYSVRCLHLLHTARDEHQEDVCVEKGPDMSPKGPSKASKPVSLITPAQSVTSQWGIQQQCRPGRWVIPGFALIFGGPHKDNFNHSYTATAFLALKDVKKHKTPRIKCCKDFTSLQITTRWCVSFTETPKEKSTQAKHERKIWN